MSDVSLNLYPEIRAAAATAFEGFGVSLPEIKRTTAELLSQIGKHGFFAEYSKHDISHIDEVLKLADWLVDEETKKIMSDADWFLITLSIYFHDMGMLVTKDEFDNRHRSSFSSFCSEILFNGQRAAEYKARVDELAPEDRDVFLYQEFVRYNHARRVRQWIDGNLDPTLGVSAAAVSEVQRVLSTLDPTLRRDLALIAESHHLDDLDDLTKYKIVQPYGSSDAETANIQFCAIILRAADLLHMRRDRTPSVLFRVINPTDPVSQREWAKQNAVRRVMPRLGLNEERIPDPKAPKDTIEVHATFTEEDGFFGLTSFLTYAAQELRKCNEWAESSKKARAAKHSFLWRKIAEDQIETEGFLKETYSFDLDQHKILDLLIGHTLYNDTGVVLRELAQNGLDAIRLHEAESGETTTGKLSVNWDSHSRILTITDTGTGMTQEIIEKHLLKVGSSRYQDQKFKEEHLYVDHVKNEIQRLMQEESYSLTWAANNAIMLVPFGFTDNRDTILPNELRDHMKGLPVYIVEKNGRRTNVAFNDLAKEETFWTVDCQLVQSAEGLVKESKADSTVANIVTALGDRAQQLPPGTILYNMDVSAMLRDSVEHEFEPIQVNASQSLRRADIQWGARTANKWTRVQEKLARKNDRAGTQFDERLKLYLDQLVVQDGSRLQRRTSMRTSPLWLAAPEVPFDGNEGYCGISSYYRTFLRGDITITKFLRDLALKANDEDFWRRLYVFTSVFYAVVDYGADRTSLAGAKLRRVGADLGEEVTQGSDQFLEALSESPLGLFDTSVWTNRHNSWPQQGQL